MGLRWHLRRGCLSSKDISQKAVDPEQRKAVGTCGDEKESRTALNDKEVARWATRHVGQPHTPQASCLLRSQTNKTKRQCQSGVTREDSFRLDKHMRLGDDATHISFVASSHMMQLSVHSR